MEQEQTNSNSTESTIVVNKMSKEQLLSNRELKKSLSEIKSQSENQLYTVYDSLNQLYIDDSFATQIISGDYESYNIPAYKMNQDSLIVYNVFLEKELDSTYSSYLITYDYLYNATTDVDQDPFSYSKEPLNTNYQLNNDFIICGMEASCDCYTLEREFNGNEDYVYRWDFIACNNENIDDGDSASGGGTGPGSSGPPSSNEPVDTNPGGSDAGNDQGSNGGTSDGNATVGGTDSDCPHSNVPSLGDGRCGSLSKPVKLTPEEILTNQLNELSEELNITWQFESVGGNTIELNTEAEIRAFLANGNDWDGMYNEVFDTQSNQTRLRTTKELYLGRNINIDIRYTKDNPNTRINEFQMNENDISTWLDGYASMGSVWTQQRSYIRDEYGDPNIAWVEITGVYSFLGKILGENIGFSKTKVITIRINKQTGEVIQLF